MDHHYSISPHAARHPRTLSISLFLGTIDKIVSTRGQLSPHLQAMRGPRWEGHVLSDPSVHPNPSIGVDNNDDASCIPPSCTYSRATRCQLIGISSGLWQLTTDALPPHWQEATLVQDFGDRTRTQDTDTLVIILTTFSRILNSDSSAVALCASSTASCLVVPPAIAAYRQGSASVPDRKAPTLSPITPSFLSSDIQRSHLHLARSSHRYFSSNKCVLRFSECNAPQQHIILQRM